MEENLLKKNYKNWPTFLFVPSKPMNASILSNIFYFFFFFILKRTLLSQLPVHFYPRLYTPKITGFFVEQQYRVAIVYVPSFFFLFFTFFTNKITI
jgi:hypothetical protein